MFANVYSVSVNVDVGILVMSGDRCQSVVSQLVHNNGRLMIHGCSLMVTIAVICKQPPGFWKLFMWHCKVHM